MEEDTAGKQQQLHKNAAAAHHGIELQKGGTLDEDAGRQEHEEGHAGDDLEQVHVV